MLRKLTTLAAAVLTSTAFAYAATIPPGLTVPVKMGSNLQSTTLANDNTIHLPAGRWRGTANADVIYAGQPVIKKGDTLTGTWGGRRASPQNLGLLLIQVTALNGQNVIAGRYSQDGGAIDKDTGIRAGTVISFMTCKHLNSAGGCAP